MLEAKTSVGYCSKYFISHTQLFIIYSQPNVASKACLEFFTPIMIFIFKDKKFTTFMIKYQQWTWYNSITRDMHFFLIFIYIILYCHSGIVFEFHNLHILHSCYYSFRPIHAMSFLLRAGKTIDYGCLTTWLQNIVFFQSNG